MKKPGTLYIVATPIGNLGDITARAIETLRTVDKIAAEDTRLSHRLLKHLSIEKPMISLHEHNEREKSLSLLAEIHKGVSIALISDAGTPLVNDPGYHLVRSAHQEGIRVVPIPGPCSLIAALSASGLPMDHFIFEGFLSSKSTSRRKYLECLAKETRTLIFFEAPHRVLDTLKDMVQSFGEKREVTLARELTKTFETIRQGVLSDLVNWVESDLMQQRGEFVLIVAGMEEASKTSLTPEAEQVLKILVSELSIKQAASLASKITGINKRLLYDFALKLPR